MIKQIDYEPFVQMLTNEVLGFALLPPEEVKVKSVQFYDMYCNHIAYVKADDEQNGLLFEIDDDTSFARSWMAMTFCENGSVPYLTHVRSLNSDMLRMGADIPFYKYQIQQDNGAFYPAIGNNPVYPALKLNGEAGEVAELIGKAIRDDGGVISPERKLKLIYELGDVLWYISAMCREIGVPLAVVADTNIKKLKHRKQYGKTI